MATVSIVCGLGLGAAWGYSQAIEVSAIEKTRQRDRGDRIDEVERRLFDTPCSDSARDEGIAILDEPSRYRRDELILRIEESRARCVVDDRYVMEFLEYLHDEPRRAHPGYTITYFIERESELFFHRGEWIDPRTPCLVAVTRLPRPTTREERLRVEAHRFCLVFAADAFE